MSSFQFSPKNQKKLSNFINEFNEAKNQRSTFRITHKIVVFKKDDYKDIFFHVYDSQDQIPKSRSSILILYLEDENNLKDYIQSLQYYTAVAIVQGRSNNFRL